MFSKIDQPAYYEIQVSGSLDTSWSEWFGGLRIESHREGTWLQGSLPDQSALLGILGLVHNLGLVLLLVKRVRDPQSSQDP